MATRGLIIIVVKIPIMGITQVMDPIRTISKRGIMAIETRINSGIINPSSMGITSIAAPMVIMPVTAGSPRAQIIPTPTEVVISRIKTMTNAPTKVVAMMQEMTNQVQIVVRPQLQL